MLDTREKAEFMAEALSELQFGNLCLSVPKLIIKARFFLTSRCTPLTSAYIRLQMEFRVKLRHVVSHVLFKFQIISC